MNKTEKKYDVYTYGRSSIDLYSNNIGAPFIDIKEFGAFVGGKLERPVLASMLYQVDYLRPDALPLVYFAVNPGNSGAVVLEFGFNPVEVLVQVAIHVLHFCAQLIDIARFAGQQDVHHHGVQARQIRLHVQFGIAEG